MARRFSPPAASCGTVRTARDCPPDRPSRPPRATSLARWVIHTVGPVYRRSALQADVLRSCYRSSLAVAAEIGATSIAFPLISSGAFGWPHGRRGPAGDQPCCGEHAVRSPRAVGYGHFSTGRRPLPGKPDTRPEPAGDQPPVGSTDAPQPQPQPRARTTRVAATGGGAITRTTLPSGLRIVSEAMPSVRSASIGVWVPIGSRHESPAVAGASHSLEHLLFKGHDVAHRSGHCDRNGCTSVVS